MDKEARRITEASIANMEANCGIKFTELRDGFARSELVLKPEHMNLLGIVYGGTIYQLADLTAGIAFLTKGGYGPTVSGDMQFINSVADIPVLYCEAEVIRYGRHLCFVQAELMDENRKTLARGNYVLCNTPKPDFIEKLSQ